MATRPSPFRVRCDGGAFTPIDLAPTMSELGIKEAVAAVSGLPVGSFGIRSAVDQRGSGFHADLTGDWDVVQLRVAPSEGGAF